MIWWLSMLLPAAIIGYYLLTGDFFTTRFWNPNRLERLPRVLFRGLGPGLVLAMAAVAIRCRRELNNTYWRVILSWALPSLLCYGANPEPPRHILPVAYAAGLCVGLAVPLERWTAHAGHRWRLAAAVVLLAVIGQSVIVGCQISRCASDRRVRFDGYASTVHGSAPEKHLLLVWQGMGEPLFWFWVASNLGDTYYC